MPIGSRDFAQNHKKKCLAKQLLLLSDKGHDLNRQPKTKLLLRRGTPSKRPALGRSSAGTPRFLWLRAESAKREAGLQRVRRAAQWVPAKSATAPINLRSPLERVCNFKTRLR